MKGSVHAEELGTHPGKKGSQGMVLSRNVIRSNLSFEFQPDFSIETGVT